MQLETGERTLASRRSGRLGGGHGLKGARENRKGHDNNVAVVVVSYTPFRSLNVSTHRHTNERHPRHRLLLGQIPEMNNMLSRTQQLVSCIATELMVGSCLGGWECRGVGLDSPPLSHHVPRK